MFIRSSQSLALFALVLLLPLGLALADTSLDTGAQTDPATLTDLSAVLPPLSGPGATGSMVVAQPASPTAVSDQTVQTGDATPAPVTDPAITPPTTTPPATTPPATTPPATTPPATTPPATTPPTTTPPTTTAPDPASVDPARIEALNGQIDSLTEQLNAAEKKLADIEKALEAEKEAHASDSAAAETLQSDLFASIETANSQIEDLKSGTGERDQLADKLAALEKERDTLVSSLELERTGKVNLDEWPTVLAKGFAEAKPRIGSWKIGAATAEQTNVKEFFSRLEMPLEQTDEPYLYRFTARSTGPGWVGFGIHFFASAVNSKRGYGEGRSLLVWFTRDPKVRKTDATWLQLYRSDTDVIMERVVDAKLEEAVDGDLAVEVSYDPGSGYVAVTVNGRLAVRYRAWFGIEKGVGVSFRTLGAGSKFSDFEIRSKAR